MQHFILEVDTPCTIKSLVVDTRMNKMKSWYLWKTWEVRHRRLSTWQLKKVFVSLLAYWRSWNLFNPTVHYFTLGHYLQSRRHQCSLLSFCRRGTCVCTARKGQSLKIATRNKFECTTKARHDLKWYGTIGSCLVESAWSLKRQQTRQGHFMQPEKAQHFPSLLHIWGGTRRFQSRYKEYNIYDIIMGYVHYWLLKPHASLSL